MSDSRRRTGLGEALVENLKLNEKEEHKWQS